MVAQVIYECADQVSLSPDTSLKGDRGTHRHRRHEEGGEHHPLGPCDLRVHAEDAEVLVRDPLESFADFLRRQLVPVLSEGRRLVERDLALLFAAVRASLPLLRLPRGLLRDEADLRHVAAELLDLFHLRHVLLGLLPREEQPPAFAESRLGDVPTLLTIAE